MTTDLPGAGAVCMLTTYGPAGALHARPVTVWPGHCPNDLLMLTEPDAAKVDEIAVNPRVGLGGATEEGWWSAEGTATLDPTRSRTPSASPGCRRADGRPWCASR